MKNHSVFVGKDILRLITIAMYDNPLTIYREYIQNSVDAFDIAEMEYSGKDKFGIHINLNYSERNIVIFDNGPGVSAEKFPGLMKTIGWSEKSGMSLRGLWGIGRLAGLAYCKQLVFRTKSDGENIISRMDWDGQKFRQILSESEQQADLSEIIDQVTEISAVETDNENPSFFEVQMNNVIRHGNDLLFNEDAVREYLGQIPPVPFHVDAPFRERIQEFLTPYVDVSGYRILLNKTPEQIHKPHREEFIYSANYRDYFSDVEFFEIKNSKDGVVVIGWLLHHSYFGALKSNPAIRGLRVRSGNMQIGDERILSCIFPEERFNSWTVGELHILDRNVRPNGQRNSLEDTPVFRNIKNKLVPIVGREIAKRCREHSSKRNSNRKMIESLESIEMSLDVIDLNVLSPEKTTLVLSDIDQKIACLQSGLSGLPNEVQESCSSRIDQMLIRLHKHRNADGAQQRHWSKSPKAQRNLVSSIADLIYDHSPSPETTSELLFNIRSLIDKGDKRLAHFQS